MIQPFKISFYLIFFFSKIYANVSDYRAVGLSCRQAIEPSDYRAVGLSCRQTIEPSDYRAVGLSIRTYKEGRRKRNLKILRLQVQATYSVFFPLLDSGSDKDLPLKYWTSGTDFQTPGTWLWGKDVPFGFSSWAGGQPMTHHCLAIDPQNQYTWVAEDCERSINFICEIQ